MRDAVTTGAAARRRAHLGAARQRRRTGPSARPPWCPGRCWRSPRGPDRLVGVEVRAVGRQAQRPQGAIRRRQVVAHRLAAVGRPVVPDYQGPGWSRAAGGTRRSRGGTVRSTSPVSRQTAVLARRGQVESAKATTPPSARKWASSTKIFAPLSRAAYSATQAARFASGLEQVGPLAKPRLEGACERQSRRLRTGAPPSSSSSPARRRPVAWAATFSPASARVEGGGHRPSARRPGQAIAVEGASQARSFITLQQRGDRAADQPCASSQRARRRIARLIHPRARAHARQCAKTARP